MAIVINLSIASADKIQSFNTICLIRVVWHIKQVKHHLKQTALEAQPQGIDSGQSTQDHITKLKVPFTSLSSWQSHKKF